MTTTSDTTLTIDLSAVAENYRILTAQAKKAQVAAVVKADAYGLGAAQVAPVLRDAGCGLFFVATLDEAIALRSVLTNETIAVLHGLQTGQVELFRTHKLMPVLNTPLQVHLWQEADIPAILHVDTGMNRLGVSLTEAEQYRKSGFRFIMTHLACADEPSHPKNQEQLAAIKQLQKLFPDTPISVANSYGTFLSSDLHYDLIRPGMALYGLNPQPGKKNPMNTVVSLTSKILQIHTVDSPQTVGYGASYMVERPGKIATVPVGYADGYLRALGNRGTCAVKGKIVPVIGRVSMDLISIDIRSIEGEVREGDAVEILGQHITADELAECAGTIGYEILTRLGRRYRRVYI